MAEGQMSMLPVLLLILICTIVGAIIFDGKRMRKSKHPRGEMSSAEVMCLNIISVMAVAGMILCIVLGVLAMVMSRTPKLNPAPYSPITIEEYSGNEPVEVTQSYQSFTVSAADAS